MSRKSEVMSSFRDSAYPPCVDETVFKRILHQCSHPRHHGATLQACQTLVALT